MKELVGSYIEDENGELTPNLADEAMQAHAVKQAGKKEAKGAEK